MCRKLLLLAVVFGVIIASSSAASAAIITNVGRSNGATDNRTPIGPYTGSTPPLPIQPGGLMNGNIVFSDRDYPWSLTPAALIGAEYVRTFNSDRTTATVTYAVTFSQLATIALAVDDRFSPQQTTVNGIVSRFASAGTFTDTGLNVYIHENSTTDRPMSVFSAVLPAGTYTFGGQGNANNFYTIIALPPPGKARNPWPGDGSMVDGDEVILTWEPGESAALHDVYCSTSFDDVDTATTSSGDVYKGRQSELVYPPGPFDTMAVNRGDIYYWRIDEVSGVNVCRGDIWSFEVLSNLNWNPNPSHQATFVPVTTDLSWSKGNLAKVGHIIYLSTDFATVNNRVPGTMGGAGYLGAASPGTVTTIAIPGDLLYNTTYYWRADVVETITPLRAYKGEVWSFTTAPENGVGTILLIAPNGAEVLISRGIYTVTWSSTGPISNILIEYSIDNGQSWSRINAVPNSGSCDWLVPAVNSNQCLVRISDANDPSINDVSDGVFMIFRELTTIYVDADANGANNGSSWEDAYNFLQDALADANSATRANVIASERSERGNLKTIIEIRVAQGTYRPDEDTLHPDGTGDRTAAFQLINGVTIKGGYAGPRISLSGADANARDIIRHETILSGDLDGNDVKGLDPSELLYHTSRIENCYHIFYHPEGSNLDHTAILDGFTITGGNADSDNWPHVAGSGMFNWQNSPTVTNCTFSGNSASAGGGMDNEYYSSPTVTNCTFSENAANYAGGGMFNDNSSPTVTGCTFNENSATERGGGMCNDFLSNPTVEGCTLSSNSVNDYGGGIYNYESSPNINNCIFSSNSAYDGGGMCNFWYSSPNVTNCTFVDNNALNGSEMACDSSQQRYPSTVTMLNCIIWNGSDWLWNNDNSIITVRYSDVQGGWPGKGNINADPCFLEPDNNDFHLLPDSPCINAGDSNYVPEPNETDIDGELRVMLGRVDMGADEFNPFAAEFVVVRKERVERTVFEYECEVVLENISRFAVRNVSLVMAEVSANMTIIDSEVSFSDADIPAGASAKSVDTCTFQVDRAEAIDPAGIIWRVTAELADTGEKVEHTLVSMPPVGPPETRFEYLAGLAERWLWTGPAGGIDQDIVQDGSVNLADFAEFAAKWTGSEN